MNAQDDDEEMSLLGIPDDQLEFKEWIHKRYLQYFVAHNGKASQRSFALELGTSDANITNYINGIRRPSGAMVDKLAESRYIGPGIYDKLGLSRKMPKNKLLLFVVDSLPQLSETEQKEVVEHIKNKLAEKAARAKGTASAGQA